MANLDPRKNSDIALKYLLFQDYLQIRKEKARKEVPYT